MKKRGKILALAAIVVVGAVVLSRCGHKNTAVEYESRPTVRVENPVRQDISLYTDLTGLVEPQSRASLFLYSPVFTYFPSIRHISLSVTILFYLASSCISTPPMVSISAPQERVTICANGSSSIRFELLSTATFPEPPMFVVHIPAAIDDSSG